LMYWFFYFSEFIYVQIRRSGYYPPASKDTNSMINSLYLTLAK